MAAYNSGPFTKSFPLGQVVKTAGVHAQLADTESLGFLNRHARGDWGEVSEDDWWANDNGLQPGREDRLLSAYTASNGKRVWVITEFDRSVTTILWAEEY